MTKEQAAEALCRCAANLLKDGLVARTWGNLSHRIPGEQFLITPSGLPYQDLSPSSLVTLSIKNLRLMEGGTPSSEKALHALIYRSIPEAQAVIHTHQTAASVLSVWGKDLPVSSEQGKELLGRQVSCCPYAKSGSSHLEKILQQRMNTKNQKAWILSNHGVILWGDSMEEAWQTALLLEQEAEAFIQQKALERSDGQAREVGERRAFYMSCYKRGLL